MLELQRTPGSYGTFTRTFNLNLTTIICPLGRNPIFRNVYRVLMKKKNTQHFLQCECLLYERCGIPCKHILRITDKIDDNMVKIQHWKVYATHFGDDSELSRKLMDARSMQQCNEGNGVPISNVLLSKCLRSQFG